MNCRRMRTVAARASHDISGFVKNITYGGISSGQSDDVPKKLSSFRRRIFVLQGRHGFVINLLLGKKGDFFS